ncbi:MAG: two-component system, OmpR family, sensor histidine kinase SenX3 [Acidimicrobiaceae bacterium]|nr:two-component system, OmpR family, sensor histidine kinase SenX3 [Acidimicrobiaceae bacterium]
MRASVLRRIAAALGRLEAVIEADLASRDAGDMGRAAPASGGVGRGGPVAGQVEGSGRARQAGGATVTAVLTAPPGVDAMLEMLESAIDRASEALEAADAANWRFVAALAHVPEGVVIADQTGTVVYRNPQAAGFVGARHGEALAERALGDLLAAALAGSSHEETIELFSPPRRTLVIRARPLMDGGRRAGAVAIIVDISARRRLEAVRRDFVANISHELKTPVGALSLVAETLEGEDDPAVVARLSHRMRTEAERLGRIIEDLLDLSRIEAEESPSREAVEVHLVVGEAVDRLRPVAEHRGIRLEIAEPRGDLIIRGDRRQLVSALHNLIDNAIKYSEDGSAVNVTVTDAGGWIDLMVADHGIGIPSRDLERVFERFYRVDRARSRDTGGTGLGLSIVRHVASNHGGEVIMDSREGEGSTFRLRLPSGAASPVSAATTNRARQP